MSLSISSSTPPYQLHRISQLNQFGIFDEPLLNAVCNVYHGDRLVEAFIKLQDNGICYKENPFLYELLLHPELSFHSIKLAEGFIALKQCGILFPEAKDHYQKVINYAHLADEFPKALQALLDTRIPYTEAKELYLAVLEHPPYHLDRLPPLLILLQQAPIPYKGNEAIYLAVANNLYIADEFLAPLTALIDAQIPSEETKMYLSVINGARNAYSIPRAFETMHQAGKHFWGHEELYRALTEYPYHASTLAKAFVALNQITGVSYTTYPRIYQILLNDTPNADKLPQALTALKDISFQGNEWLYDTVVDYIRCAHLLQKALDDLKEANIPLLANKEFTTQVIENLDCGKLSQALGLLKEQNICFQGHESLYVKVARKLLFTDQIALVCAAYKKAAISDEKLFDASLDDLNNVPKLLEILSLFDTLGINSTDHNHYFNTHLLFEKNDLVIYACKQLSPEIPKEIVYKVLDRINDKTSIDRDTLTIVEKLNKSDQLSELLHSIVDSHATALDSLQLGPLKRSKATVEVEELLRRISETGPRNITIFFKLECYYIKIADQKEINLSLLLKNANLSHLTLTSEVITSLGIILDKCTDELFSKTSDNPIVQLLSPAQQMAINAYTSDDPKYYININKLFRWEPLNSSTTLDPLAYFIIGCLVNHAAACDLKILPGRVDEKRLLDSIAYRRGTTIHHFSNLDEWKDIIQNESSLSKSTKQKLERFLPLLPQFYPKETVLDRGETLPKVILDGRTANFWKLPAITSCSTLENGVSEYHGPGSTRTKLPGISSQYPVINSSKQEILLPHGEQVVTTAVKGQYLISKIVRSPSLEQEDQQLSDLALHEAFFTYLSKPYTEGYPICINPIHGVKIARFDYGLTYTFRLMLYVKQVGEYFSRFAKDKEFKKFCLNQNYELLRAAAAFSATSKPGEGNDTQQAAHQMVSSKHFITFIDTAAPDTDPKVKMQLAHVLCHLGNKEYEREFQGEDTSSIFTHRLFTLSQMLDVFRQNNKGKKEYAEILSSYNELSVHTASQQNALIELNRYAFELRDAHGLPQEYTVSFTGELIDKSSTYYKKEFVGASTSLKSVMELSNTVPPPRFFI